MQERTSQGLEERYWEAAKARTWSGIDVKEVYSPADIAQGNGRLQSLPGEFPYTRGIFPNMYRGRLWTRRQPWGFGSAEDTNKQLKFLIEHGNTGLSIYRDMPTLNGIDVDHPLSFGQVGMTGVSLCTLKDMEELFDGIPLDKVSSALLCGSVVASVILAQYIVVAQSRGLDIAKLRGTSSTDSLVCYVCAYKEASPLDLSVKLWVDIVEYTSRHMPLWHTAYSAIPYNVREFNVSAQEEIAFGLSAAIDYIDAAVKRGIDVDDVGRRYSFYCSAGIDIFEEVAKFRAMRRMWADIMKNRLGAKDPRSWQFRFSVQAMGSSLVRQQPLNNIARTAYESLAAVLGGCQSINCTSYNEPISLATEEAHRAAIGIQGILAYETGVPNVADPLGGSYYVESLTDRMEEEAKAIMSKIADIGGFVTALDKGWIEQRMHEANLKYYQSIESGERLIVGQNILAVPPEEDPVPEGAFLRVSPEAEKKQIVRLQQIKEQRDRVKHRTAMEDLRVAAGKGERENLLPPIVEAVRAYATVEEIMGTIRKAYGHKACPWGMRELAW